MNIVRVSCYHSSLPPIASIKCRGKFVWIRQSLDLWCSASNLGSLVRDSLPTKLGKRTMTFLPLWGKWATTLAYTVINSPSVPFSFVALLYFRNLCEWIADKKIVTTLSNYVQLCNLVVKICTIPVINYKSNSVNYCTSDRI